MARPEIVKTELGERLRSVRRSLGDPAREHFAQLIGISPKTLANHERGDSAPDANVLTAYRTKCGVDINWLVTGDGEMFSARAGGKEPALTDPELLERLSDRVSAFFRELDQKPPPRRIMRETINLYNALLKAVPDLEDREMVEAVLPRLELEFKRRLQLAATEPGSGKRSAS